METENQLSVLNSMLGDEMDSSPLCLQTSKNKRKNFNPRFAESKDEEIKLKVEVEAASESEKEEEEQQNTTAASLASFMAAGTLEAAAVARSEAESKYRDFAFKTMQELLNIYGLSLTFNDVVDAFKQQQQRLRESK